MIVKDIAQNISSGFESFSARITAPTANHTLFSPTTPAPSIDLGTPSDTSSAPKPTGLLSGAMFTRLPLPQLPRKEFPKVKHWDKTGYNSSRKAGKSGVKDDPEIQEGKKASILSSYMEDENGDQVPEETKVAARETARAFFHLLDVNNRLPPTWKALSIDAKNEYLYLMESAHPFLHLCENHWKADRIAINSYSQWSGKPSDVTGGQNVDDAEAADVNAGNSDNHNKLPKRPRAEDGEKKHPKRPRVEEVRSTPQPAKITSQRQRVCKSLSSWLYESLTIFQRGAYCMDSPTICAREKPSADRSHTVQAFGLRQPSKRPHQLRYALAGLSERFV